MLFAEAPVNFPFRGVRDGEVLELGNVAIEVLHTPGHTPEHISLLVTDRTRADAPWFALTGHTLMVGDLGRTELATNAEEGARALFRSVQRLKVLPDYHGNPARSLFGLGVRAQPQRQADVDHRI